MARRRKAHAAHEEGHENSERWLLTYADMITLLMVLFIVLFAIGETNKDKFNKLHDGLAMSFGTPGVLDGGAGILTGSEKQSPTPDESRQAELALARQRQLEQSALLERQQMDQIKARITAALAKKGLADAVQFTNDERGLVVNVVTDRVLFDLGQADLRGEGRAVLDAIAPALKGLPNRVAVEGHTDNAPIHSPRFASNWELSTDRATTVLRYLIGHGLAAARSSAAGYADQRPLAPNDTTAHRARNRRVAIVVMSLSNAQPGGDPFPQTSTLSTGA
jgi:chemotaxis protein MotB